MEVKDYLPLSELRRLERVEKDADRAKRLRSSSLASKGGRLRRWRWQSV